MRMGTSEIGPKRSSSLYCTTQAQIIFFGTNSLGNFDACFKQRGLPRGKNIASCGPKAGLKWLTVQMILIQMIYKPCNNFFSLNLSSSRDESFADLDPTFILDPDYKYTHLSHFGYNLSYQAHESFNLIDKPLFRDYAVLMKSVS